MLNDDRADWREAWALFPGDVAYVWHGALHAATVAESLEACGFAIRSADHLGEGAAGALAAATTTGSTSPAGMRCARRARRHWTGDRKQTTLWQIPSRDQDAATVHGTQKPVEAMRRPMLNNSAPGQPVYDPFLGSGTSVIAAETTRPRLPRAGARPGLCRCHRRPLAGVHRQVAPGGTAALAEAGAGPT